MQGSVSFEPSQVVITSGATPAMEILSFCLADPGNAFLVPSPYYPGYVSSPISRFICMNVLEVKVLTVTSFLQVGQGHKMAHWN